ncbi:hypothetical protein NliqN6_2025 [Naganishia liquefaciens]|uniref:Non-structural maintenance of chromosomes element 4 n=1 Tax=Naganishia liquefaciens TaxID=104408 RepID=A0A8H3TRL9_9TREE|nr:hypothetical protein NliqN6_2025 [Naganishia liquefaciens]
MPRKTAASQDLDREIDSLQEGEQRNVLTEGEMRGLKRQLRRLQKKAENDNIDPSKLTPAELAQNVSTTNKLFEKLGRGGNSSLAVIDSKIMTMHSDSAMKLGKQARAMANAFEPGDFFDPLRDLLGLDAQMLEDVDVDEEDRPAVRRGGKLGNWAKIGWLAARRSRRAPGVEFMNGVMAIEHKRRVINRKARQKQVAQPEVRPQEIRQEDMTKAANPTITNTSALATLLEEQDPDLNYFEWVINPKSFGQTVENIFYTSFLVSSSLAAIDVKQDGSGIPIIFSCEPPSEEDKRAQYDAAGNEIREALTKRQVVMEMSMEAWQEAIELFGITKGIIPHREEEEEQRPSASGWYA